MLNPLQAATSVCLTSEILLNCRGLEDVLDIFVLDVFASLACAKGIIVRVHQEDVYDNVSSAVEDWSKPLVTGSARYRDIMTKHARIGRVVCLSLMGPASGGTLSWIIFALPLSVFDYSPNGTDQVMRNFPLQTACTFEAVTDSRFYYVIFVLQVIQLITTCLGNCGNDVFFFGIAMHVCGQFEILKEEFSSIGTGDSENEKIVRKKLADLARRHAHLVGLVDKLEDTFNLIILVQLVMSAILICIMGKIYRACAVGIRTHARKRDFGRLFVR